MKMIKICITTILLALFLISCANKNTEEENLPIAIDAQVLHHTSFSLAIKKIIKNPELQSSEMNNGILITTYKGKLESQSQNDWFTFIVRNDTILKIEN